MTQQDFDQKWRAAIKGRNDDKFHMDWESIIAIHELKKRGCFELACRPAGFSAELLREAHLYEKCRTGVVRTNRMLWSAGSKLERVQTEIDGLRRELQRIFPEQTVQPTCDYLSHLSFLLQQEGLKLRAELEFVWQAGLATNPLGLDALSLDDKIRPSNFGFLKPSELMSIQQDHEEGSPTDYFKSRLLPNQVIKKLNLDSTFQIRAAAILTFVFPRLTKMTIARLAVLACICADLTNSNIEDGLKIKGNKSKLTVSAVYQKIKGIRFPRTDGSSLGHVSV